MEKASPPRTYQTLVSKASVTDELPALRYPPKAQPNAVAFPAQAHAICSPSLPLVLRKTQVTMVRR